MIKKSLLVFLFIILFVSPLHAEGFDFLGSAKFRTSFDIDLQNLSLKDSADNIYIGDFSKTGWGFGGNAALLYPINDKMRVGPNFNFSYGKVESSWYALSVFQPSIGPMFEMDLDSGSLSLFLDYNLGWVSAEQELTSTTGLNPAPAGSFNADMRGWIIGAKGRFPVNEQIVLGPYITYGNQSLLSFKYNSLVSGSYTAKWLNIDIAYLQAGVAIYLDQFLKFKKE